MIRGWAANEVAVQNRDKVDLSKEFTRLESLAEIRDLSSVERQELAHIEDKLEKIWSLEEIRVSNVLGIETFLRVIRIRHIFRRWLTNGVEKRK